jgi:hypothetical protein
VLGIQFTANFLNANAFNSITERTAKLGSGIRTGGSQGTELLAQPVNAYRSAPEVYTREVFPSYYELVRKHLDKTATLLAQAKPDVQ